MIDAQLQSAARRIIETCTARGLTIATAESCTGGLVAGALTEIAGSSAVVLCGFVTYSNEAKQRMLGVSAETLAAHGAVSRPTAQAIAEGALVHSPASPDRAADQPRSRSGSCILRPRRGRVRGSHTSGAMAISAARPCAMPRCWTRWRCWKN